MSRPKLWYLAGALCLIAVGLPGPGVAASVFTDRAAWEASLAGPLSLETFDADITTADSITFATGIVSSKSSTGVPPTLNRVAFGDYDGFVARDGFRTIDWRLPVPVNGIGGDFGGSGPDIGSLSVSARFVDDSSETFSISDALGGTAGFFGLSSSTAIASLLFTTDAGVVLVPGGAPFGGQSFTADNVALAPVPLPGGLALMLGVIGIGGSLAVRRHVSRCRVQQSS